MTTMIRNKPGLSGPGAVTQATIDAIRRAKAQQQSDAAPPMTCAFAQAQDSRPGQAARP